MDNSTVQVYIDGIDGTGKTTIVNLLKLLQIKIDNQYVIINDRSILTKLTDIHYDLLPFGDQLPKGIYIILDASVEECRKRIANRCKENNIKDDDKYETREQLFMYRYRYRYLAAKYGLHLINTTHMISSHVLSEVSKIISGKCNDYLVPCPDKMTDEMFENLEKITEGESKIIRRLNKNFHLVKYKPTIYSHKKQRAGIIDGSDIERMKMTRATLDILSRHMLGHTYWYVGDKFILTESLEKSIDIPPVEVIVKGCYVGTDKHRYFELDKLKNRFGQPVVLPNSEYQHPIVRFDIRNPNHHPVSGEPFGDYAISTMLADQLIDAKTAEFNALKAFTTLKHHFGQFGVYLQDICFMFTTDGTRLFGEISQDCGRYKNVNEDQLSDLDKDIWRAGGSSDKVLEKYKIMTQLITNYVKKLYPS